MVYYYYSTSGILLLWYYLHGGGVEVSPRVVVGARGEDGVAGAGADGLPRDAARRAAAADA